MDKDAYSELRDLQNYGWKVEQGNKIKFNAGGSSETLKHIWAKNATAVICLRNGYQIDTEVEHESRGEIDVLAYGHDSRLTYAIEAENSPQEETIKDKMNRYVGGPIDDILVINVTNLPMDLAEAAEFVGEEIGLSL